MAVAPELLNVPQADPPTVVARARPRKSRPSPRNSARPRRRPRLPVDRQTARRILEESIAASSIPIILGSKPLEGATIWVQGGVIQVARKKTRLTLDRCQNRRVIRGFNPKWMVEVECRLIRTTEGWREVYSQLSEYTSIEDLSRHQNPVRKQSTRVNEDGSVLTITFSHSRVDGDDTMRRTSCVTRTDGSRIEEQEESVRMGNRERYELTRTEYDEDFRRLRTLTYAYPEQSADFYRPMREKLVNWDEEMDWLGG